MTRTTRQRLRLLLIRAFAQLTPSPSPQLSGPWPADSRSSLPKRILVLRPDHMGDVLFTTPALRVLRERYPNAHITALIGPWGASVLSNNPHLDDVKTLPYPGFTRQTKPYLWQPYAELYRWAQRLRGQYDAAFILRFDHWWGALLTYLARVPQRIGFAVPEVAPLLSHVVPYIPGRHEVKQNLRLSSWDLRSGDALPQLSSGDLSATASPAHHPLEFNIPAQARAWAKSALPATYPVAIHPGAGAAVKLWEVQRWAAVADAFAQENGAQVMLTGAEAERPLCLEIAALMATPARVMAGETELDQLAALFSRCRLVLGVDSGPLHLAVAAGTPTVHLYGPVDPATFGPWGPPERHRVLSSAWPCIPCNQLDYRPDELAHHPCVREISVSEVLNAARQALPI